MSALWRLRAGILVLAGAAVVHEVRFLFAAPEHRDAVAGAHGYVPWLVAGLGALLFVMAAHLTLRLGRAEGERPRLPRFGALWGGSVVALLSIFIAQECAETAYAHGHLPGLHEALGGGAWIVVPLALVCGAVIALALKGAAAAVAWALRRSLPPRRRTSPGPRRPRPAVLVPRGSVLARRLAGRAPPA